MEKEINTKKIINVSIYLILAVIVLSGCFYTVSAGYRGVLLTFGKPDLIEKGEGLGIKIPFVQTVKKVEVRKQLIQMEADSASKDLQDVAVVMALNFHVDPDKASEIYQGIGMDYKDRIIKPTLQEGVRAISAKYNAEELITKRAEVREDIRLFLESRLSKYYILVDDFNIVNFQFSDEFDKAIEAKVTAEQLKLKADRDLERIKVEKEQAITKAQAEAESLRMQKQEVTQELIELRKIEMMKMAIEKWDGVMPQATSGMPFIDVTPK